MSAPETVYDSTDIQMRRVAEAITENLTPNDLASPEQVHMILQRELVHLTELKALKSEIAALRSENMRLRDAREELRIELAKSGERGRLSLIEIPISILSGFAINMLTNDPKNGLGWVLLITTFLMLIFLRLPQILAMARRENTNGAQKD